MDDMEKLNIFQHYLENMGTAPIRRFTEFAIVNLPEYFWTLPASTTRKNHGDGETVLGHTLACLAIAEEVNNGQFKDHWTQRQKDQLIASLILHDGWRCGDPGNECRITQEMIDKKGYDQDLLGSLKTAKDHAEVAYRQLIMLSAQFNKMAIENKEDPIGAKNLSMILKAVRYHYGPFLEIKDRPFSLSWPYDSVVMQCHNVDFHQCHNMMYMTRGKKIKRGVK